MAKQGRRLRRDEVTAWVDDWSTVDRARIAAALDTVPHAVCIIPPYGGRIGIWRDSNLHFTIYPGYVSWPHANWAAQDFPAELFKKWERDTTTVWHELSTFRPNAAPPSST